MKSISKQTALDKFIIAHPLFNLEDIDGDYFSFMSDELAELERELH